MKINLKPKKEYKYQYSILNRWEGGYQNSGWRHNHHPFVSRKSMQEVAFEIAEKEWGPKGYFIYTYRDQPYMSSSYRVNPNAWWFEFQLRKNDDKRRGFTIRYIVRRLWCDENRHLYKD
jgi:hypothetical protein